MKKQPITEWWFFIQPNGLFGCYDEVTKEIRSFNLSREEALLESEEVADLDAENDDFDFDHEAALECASEEQSVPTATEMERSIPRLQVALMRDRLRYGDERIEEYVDGLMAGSVQEVKEAQTFMDKMIAALSEMTGIRQEQTEVARPRKNIRAQRLNEKFDASRHLEDVTEALKALGDIDSGELAKSERCHELGVDIGHAYLQVERNDAGGLISIALGPKVGEPLCELGLAQFTTLRTEAGYRLKYYSITDKGREALVLQRLGEASTASTPPIQRGYEEGKPPWRQRLR